jgi:hypothetical protein
MLTRAYYSIVGSPATRARRIAAKKCVAASREAQRQHERRERQRKANEEYQHQLRQTRLRREIWKDNSGWNPTHY